MSSTSTTRRTFLIVTAGSAAAVATGLEGVVAEPAQAVSANASRNSGTASGGSLVAHVKDLRGDTVSLLVGEDEVVVRDPDLVARLARAAR
jgi:hypothetical protein